MARERLDQALVRLGLAESVERARALLLAGQVLVNGQPADKAGDLLEAGALVTLKDKDHGFVSRGALKLQKGLEHFGVSPRGHRCLDIGSSTGGFTQVLLLGGAVHVVAIDVGYGQLAWELRQDPRVTCLERTNVRHVERASLPGPSTLAVVDVSFIALRAVLPKIIALLEPQSSIVALVKPQFEVNKEQVGKGGVVRDEQLRMNVLRDVASSAKGFGCTVHGHVESPILGPAGNHEYLMHIITPSRVESTP